MTPETDPLLVQAIDAIISAYHTTRLRDAPVAAHILLKPTVQNALAALHSMQSRDATLSCYDAGILSDFGGGDVDWWQDYIRSELGRAHDFYASHFEATPAQSGEATTEPADVMIGEFVARYDEAADGCMMDADTAQALAREFKRMRGLIYCPGVLRCAKCDFRLIKTTLTPSGAFANEEPDSCPNCNVPMWRVTWQDEARDAYKTAESQMNRALEAEKALRSQIRDAEPVADDHEGTIIAALDDVERAFKTKGVMARTHAIYALRRHFPPTPSARIMDDKDGGIAVEGVQSEPVALAEAARDLLRSMHDDQQKVGYRLDLWNVLQACLDATPPQAAALQSRVEALDAENGRLDQRETDLMAEMVGMDHQILTLRALIERAMKLLPEGKSMWWLDARAALSADKSEG